MKYLCLVYVEEKTLHAMPQNERIALSNESMAYCDELQKQGQLLAASPLHPVPMVRSPKRKSSSAATC
jgi:hypothetical protein